MLCKENIIFSFNKILNVIYKFLLNQKICFFSPLAENQKQSNFLKVFPILGQNSWLNPLKITVAGKEICC
jgi:hypothetical protein